MALTTASWTIAGARAAEPSPNGSVFAKTNLAAWCIVPFDALKRGPQQRAEMLQRLGIGKLAYDWRNEHVPTFEDEIIQCQKHSIDFFAFWGFHPTIVPLLAKYHVTPQFWIFSPSPTAASDAEKVDAAVKGLRPLVEKTRQLGCKFGLYNHEGWGGEPANMVAIVKRLREGNNQHVGIVYNFNHGHGHIHDFAKVLADMQPYLLCINLNGMVDHGPRILPIGAGQYEQAMMEAIQRSGYAGPIGIISERGDTDAEKALQQDLDGMKKILKRMGDDAALKTYGGE
jgi:hypothetical protein